MYIFCNENLEITNNLVFRKSSHVDVILTFIYKRWIPYLKVNSNLKGEFHI